MSIYGNPITLGGGGAPDFIEYIESSGSQYIDTGYTAQETTCLELIAAISSTQTTSYATPLGASAASYTSELFIRAWKNGSPFIYAAWGNGRYKDLTSGFSAFAEPIEFRLDKNRGLYLRQNGSLVSQAFSGTASSYPTSPLCLFGNSVAGNIEQQCAMKFYGLRIWENGQLVRHFLPAVDPDGVACVYELLSGAFHYNDGSGSFAVPTSE